jgi:hypothetical protein
MTALSLTGNFIRFLAHDAFVKLTVLRTLDLANNQLRQIEPDTFIVQSGLRALQLSGNPLEVLPSRCFSGLASLNILGLAYIPTDDVRIDADVLADAGKSLVRLDIDGSPAVARILLGDEAATNRGSRHLLDAISGVRELNVRSSDLTRLRPQHLPLSLRRQLDGSTATAATQSAAVLRISSSRWHCDADLIWLRDRLLQLTADVADSSVSSSRLQADSEKAAKEAEDENRCATPRQVAGRLLTSLSDSEFEPVVSFHRTSTTATLVLSRSTASGIQIARTPTTGDEALTALNALTTTTDRTHLRDAGDGDKSVGQGISENELTTKYGVQRAGHGTRTQLSAVTAETALDGSRVAAAATIEHENRRRFIERDRWHKWIIDDYDTDDEPETVDIGHNVKDFAVQNNDRGNMTAGVGSRLNGVVRPLHQSLPVTLSNGDINLPLSDDQPLSGTRRSTHGRAVGSLPARTGDVIGERRSLAVHSGDTGSRTTATTTTLYAAAATVGVTVVVAVVIIAVIIRLVRDKKNPPPQALPLTQHPAPDKQPPNPDNAGGCSVAAEDVIEYRHPNGMLYFALQPTVAHSSPLPSRCLHTPRDVTSIDDCLPSTLSSIGAASGDLSLPPSAAAGHDVMMMLSKSAEPLRIYKWEDF